MAILDFLFKKQIKKLATKTADSYITKYVTALKATYQNYFTDFAGMFSGAKWPYGLSASGASLTIDHYTTRQNVRYADHDNPIAKAIKNRFADTIADIGLKRECTPDTTVLKITPKQGEKWAENVNHRFHLYCQSKKQHRSGQYNFYQSHRMYAGWIFRDNDIFTRLYYSQRKELLNPLQFDFVDPNQIRGDAFTSSLYQLTGDDGIVRNSDNTEKAYKVWLQVPGKYEYKDVTIPAIGPRSKRIMMLHGFAPEYAGQGRGYSPLTHAIQDFENATDFKSSVIKKAIAQSSLALGVENDQLDPSNPLEGLNLTGGAGPITDTGDEFIPAPPGPRIDYCQLPEATLNTPGSVGVFNLQKGDHLKQYENRVPAESYESFMNAFIAYLSASVGMPIEILLIKFNRSYSAARAGIIIFWRNALIWRYEMQADYLDPIFEMWLSEEIAAGRISAPGWQDPILRAAWLTGNWIGSPMPQIDPQRAAKANEINVGMGLTTLDREARQLNGTSGKANRAKLTEEYKELPPSPFKKGGGNG